MCLSHNGALFCLGGFAPINNVETEDEGSVTASRLNLAHSRESVPPYKALKAKAASIDTHSGAE